mmetsp:Transcript_28516/g.39397  ORF Transcript_28516/g.39397 Transcript_28516/m.39397 type:complete len:216 (-) Transcript_28516:204-851(-)|eukprot:CAMPEP_0196579752 /NCGR_PEP_ID=MMETSP1081-20130531/24494_1 /TAXON_ID=36882 /ORGANISM="Pyramimonas amylifera, Strain CCMP720" /LENGTH=215 /DNA_ID=CAMNT_0041899423 /DNA_START=95 /DNA_END=742 /DNA_ORIENTATION=+
MGGNNSNLKKALVEEYNRVNKSGNEYLVLHDLLNFNLPNLIQLNLTHIGVLFVIDRSLDGKYTLEKLMGFFELCGERARLYRAHEFQAQIHGFCALQLWNCVASREGKDKFESWFCHLIQESEAVCQGVKGRIGRGEFVSRDTIQDLYEVLSVFENHGMDFQSFFDLLQRVGEEKGAMDLENESLDDYAPLEVLRDFSSSYILGFREGLNLDALE